MYHIKDVAAEIEPLAHEWLTAALRLPVPS